jgi:hypothetical protein
MSTLVAAAFAQNRRGVIDFDNGAHTGPFAIDALYGAAQSRSLAIAKGYSRDWARATAVFAPTISGASVTPVLGKTGSPQAFSTWNDFIFDFHPKDRVAAKASVSNWCLVELFLGSIYGAAVVIPAVSRGMLMAQKTLRPILALILAGIFTSHALADDFQLRNLSNGLDDSQIPLINGNNVVWIGRQGSTNDVYRYHIPSQTRTTLTDATTSLGSVAIDGNYVVWEDFGIYLHDLSTGFTTTLSSEPRSRGPRISGNNVIWQEGRPEDSLARLMNYRIDSTSTQQLAGFGDRSDLRIDGIDVVWDGRVGASADSAEVFHYNLQSALTTRMTTNSIPDVYPEVSSGRVAWQTFDTQLSAEIFVRDLQTGITQRLTTNSEPDRTSVISGTNVVWQAGVGGGAVSNILHRDLLTGTTTALTNSTGHPQDHGVPKVNGSSVVWNGLLNFGAANREIFFHDLTTGVTSQVTENTFREQDADVYGSRVVFRREEPIFSNRWNIYLAAPVPEPSTIALLIACGLTVVIRNGAPRCGLGQHGM